MYVYYTVHSSRKSFDFLNVKKRNPERFDYRAGDNYGGVYYLRSNIDLQPQPPSLAAKQSLYSSLSRHEADAIKSPSLAENFSQRIQTRFCSTFSANALKLR